MNVSCQNESVATDTVYCDTPDIEDGSTLAQIFVGKETLLTDVYGIKSYKQFARILSDNIRQRGAMSKLISDRAQVEISNKVKDILRALFIDDWQSEPYKKLQNPAERRYQTIKSRTNTLLDRNGAPSHCWLLAMMYICFILNHAYNTIINTTPLQAATGSTCDISPLLRFTFWQPVYFAAIDSTFGSESPEERGRFVGIAENLGHAMTFKILKDDTQKIVCRSNVCPGDDPLSSNLRIDPATIPSVVKSRQEAFKDDETASTAPSTLPDDNNYQYQPTMPIIDISDLVGRSLLMTTPEDSQRLRVKIVKALESHEDDLSSNPARKDFLCTSKDDTVEEIMHRNTRSSPKSR